MTSLLGSNLTYSEKDFDSLRVRLINLARSAFPEWTDFNVANFGNLLLELFAFVGDVLLFYQDNQARESRISTAQLRKNMLALTKLIGYLPRGSAAATANLTVTLAAVPVGDVLIPARSTFRTEQITTPVIFQTLVATTIPAGTNPPVATITVENSAFSLQVFVSTGLPNQEYILNDYPYLDSSARVSADGVYTQVDNFLDSLSTSAHFTVTVDENDRATIRFGNGISGSIPVGNISVLYKTGGGVTGNVESNSIVRVDVPYKDEFGNAVVMSVTNPAAASNGFNRDGLEQIRIYGPESLRTLTRTVSREDYEINARRVSGVSRALMLTSNERPGILENQGMLHVIPTGGGLPTQLLKDAVLTSVTETYPNTLTFLVSVEDPEYLPVDVQATVFLSAGQTASVVSARILANLTSFFAIETYDGSPNTTVNFGYYMQDENGDPINEIAWSDVFNVIRDTTGVRKIGDTLGSLLLNGERSDVSIGVQQFPTLGNVVLLNGSTGSAL